VANGEICKTCGFQETQHEAPRRALNEIYQWEEIPSHRRMRKLTREQIRDCFIALGLPEEEICEFFFDVVRCPGFSTTRRPNKNWVSYQNE